MGVPEEEAVAYDFAVALGEMKFAAHLAEEATARPDPQGMGIDVIARLLHALLLRS